MVIVEQDAQQHTVQIIPQQPGAQMQMVSWGPAAYPQQAQRQPMVWTERVVDSTGKSHYIQTSL